jgi:hypothetical protein
MSTGFAYEDGNDDDDIVIQWGEQQAAQPARREFDALPAGVYPVTVLEATHQISSNGNKMLVLTLEVSDGEHQGRRLWERIAYVPSIEWKLRQVIGALMGAKTGGVQTFKRQELLGLGAKVMVVESEYNDRPTNKITEWLPADSPIGDDPGDDSDDDVNVNWDGNF